MLFSFFFSALVALMAHAAPAPNPDAPNGASSSSSAPVSSPLCGAEPSPSTSASNSPVASASPAIASSSSPAPYSAIASAPSSAIASAPSSSVASAPSSSSSSSSQHGGKRYIAYWNIWAGPTLLPSASQLKGVTHVVLAFMNVTSASGSSPDTGGWPTETTPFSQSDIASLQSAGIKVMIALGGWNMDNHFRPGSADATTRDVYTTAVIKFMTSLGLDGIDLDWEYPVDNGQNYKLPSTNPMSRPFNAADAANFVALAKEFRKKLDADTSKKMYLSLAAPSRHADMIAYGMTGIAAGLDESVDWWNLMTYDFMNRRDNTTQHQAGGMVIADNLAKYRDESGIKAEKLNIGFPMYGKWFQVQSSCTAAKPIGCETGVVYEGDVGEDLGTSGWVTFNPATNDNSLMSTAFAAIDQDKFSFPDALASATIAEYNGQNYFWTWLSASDVGGACSKYLPEVGGVFFWGFNQDSLGQQGGVHIDKIAACVTGSH